MNVTDLALSVGRALLAWVAATFAGALIGVVLISYFPFWGGAPELRVFATLVAFVWVLGAICSAPFALALVFAIRLLGLPRPWADVLGGACVAVVLLVVVSLWFGAGPFGLDSSTSPRDIVSVYWLATMIPSGAVAGGVYWLIAAAPLRIWAGLPR